MLHEAQAPAMQTLVETDTLRILYRTGFGSENRTLLSFTGAHHALGGIDVQKPEFHRAGAAFGKIVFVIDKTSSWGSNVDFRTVAKIAADVAGGGAIHAVGNSMGAFNLIAAARFIPIGTGLCFVPQFSIDPAVAPWETRPNRYVPDLDPRRLPDLRKSVHRPSPLYVFSSGMGLDARQAALFPVHPNIHHFLFRTVGHNLAAVLKAEGTLDTVIRSAFDGHLDLAALRDLHPGDIAQLSPSPEPQDAR